MRTLSPGWNNARTKSYTITPHMLTSVLAAVGAVPDVERPWLEF